LLLGKLLRGDHIRETSRGLRRATPPRSRSLPVCIRFLCNDSAVGCGIEWRVESTIYCLVEPGPDSAKESALLGGEGRPFSRAEVRMVGISARGDASHQISCKRLHRLDLQ